MEKDILGRAVEIRCAKGEDRWEAWANLYEEGRKASEGVDALEREFYGFGDEQEDAQEMIEILVTNYLKKKWKKERLRGLSD
ncbi:MAG: hypothetical protein ACE5JS_11440 [Nitrospinota bacterium]